MEGPVKGFLGSWIIKWLIQSEKYFIINEVTTNVITIVVLIKNEKPITEI